MFSVQKKAVEFRQRRALSKRLQVKYVMDNSFQKYHLSSFCFCLNIFKSTLPILTEKMDEKKKLVSDSEKFSPRLFFVLPVFS